MSHPLRSVLPALAVIAVVVALGPASVGIGVAGGDETGTGGSVTVSSAFCLGDGAATGVLTTAPAGEGLLVTGNVTVAGDDPTVTVREQGDGQYTIVVQTDGSGSDACRTTSTVTLARRLPADASTVSVVVNGERVGSVTGVGVTSLS